MSNIESAKALADAIRTSLGPRGMDKMVRSRRSLVGRRHPRARGRRALRCQVSQPNGEVVITNDGATIMNKMVVTQPAAKMLVELSKSQARPASGLPA